MGVRDILMPFREEYINEHFPDWVSGEVPETLRNGRLPTWQELTTVLTSNIPTGYKILYSQSTYPTSAQIVDNAEDKGLLRVEQIKTENETEPFIYSFTGNRDYLLTIIQHLPDDCGTLILTLNSEEIILLTVGE